MQNYNKTYDVSICGVGRLGLPLALNFSAFSKMKVLGFDIKSNYISLLNSRKFKSFEPGVNNLLKKSKIKFTTNIPEILQSKNLIICVRTDSKKNGNYDLKYLHNFINNLNKLLKTSKTKSKIKSIIINCNVNPNTCEKIKSILCDKKIEVYFWPEWVKQGTILKDQQYPSFSVLGHLQNKKNINEVKKIISESTRKKNKLEIITMMATEAEVSKIALNCFLTVKISYANMIANLCDKIGLNSNLILDTIGKDPRINNKFFKPGFGYGGPCLPRDNKALIAYSKKFNLNMDLCEAADSINEKRHVSILKKKIKEYKNTKKPITINSLSYKKEIPIFIESQQLRLALDLKSKKIPLKIKESKKFLSILKDEFPKIDI
jgi:nucleotide sugar dehydrogenase